MKFLHLVRVSQSELGTFGVFVYEGVAFAITLELPWKQNASLISCIPAGDYRCTRVVSPKFGETYEVTGVPGRTHVLFHKGNRVTDTNGCILIGESFSKDADRPIIADSLHGYWEFRSILGTDEEFLIRIHEAVIR